MVTDAREVLDAAAADHDGRVLLEVMPFPADVGGDFVAVGQTDTGILPEGGVRLLRGHGADTGADAPLLGGGLIAAALGQRVPPLAEGGALRLLNRGHATLPNELVDCWHNRLSLL